VFESKEVPHGKPDDCMDAGARAMQEPKPRLHEVNEDSESHPGFPPAGGISRANAIIALVEYGTDEAIACKDNF
jgi:hypothetical protein